MYIQCLNVLHSRLKNHITCQGGHKPYSVSHVLHITLASYSTYTIYAHIQSPPKFKNTASNSKY